MTEEFGRRLRRERERRHITLASISAHTKISQSLFEGLEREDVSRWPAGIFRRAFIRAYATGIGLDPDEVMREFLERFPEPTELLPPLKKETTLFSSSRTDKTALRLTLADSGSRFSRKCVLDLPRRWAAVAFDAAVVFAIAAGVFLASGTFWLPFAIAMSTYYWGGIVVLGNTPGVWLLTRAAGRRRHEPSAPISIRRRVTSAADELILGLNRAASVQEPQGALRSEPRASGS